MHMCLCFNEIAFHECAVRSYTHIWKIMLKSSCWLPTYVQTVKYVPCQSKLFLPSKPDSDIIMRNDENTCVSDSRLPSSILKHLCINSLNDLIIFIVFVYRTWFYFFRFYFFHFLHFLFLNSLILSFKYNLMFINIKKTCVYIFLYDYIIIQKTV